MTEPPFTPDKFVLYKWHKTIGVIILGLVIGRILWRVASPPPPLPKDTPPLERWAAHSTHLMIYLAIIAIPLSGWLLSSAAPFPNFILGNVQLPSLVAQNEETAAFFSTMHYWGGRGLLALLVIHVSAALYHHYVRKDTILIRMLPKRPSKEEKS